MVVRASAWEKRYAMVGPGTSSMIRAASWRASASLASVSIAGRPLTETTYAQLCGEQALPMELVQRIHEASGLGRPRSISSRRPDSLGVVWATPR